MESGVAIINSWQELSEGIDLQPALKVLYSRPDDLSKNIVEEWVNDTSCEKMFQSNECAIQILEALDKSNKLLSPDKQILGNSFKVGLLVYK